MNLAVMLMLARGMTCASLAHGFSIIFETAPISLTVDEALRILFDVEAEVSLLERSWQLWLLPYRLFCYGKLLLPVYIVVGGIVHLTDLRPLKVIRHKDVGLMKKYLGDELAFAVGFWLES